MGGQGRLSPQNQGHNSEAEEAKEKEVTSLAGIKHKSQTGQGEGEESPPLENDQTPSLLD
jgi:hypothetical protein